MFLWITFNGNTCFLQARIVHADALLIASHLRLVIPLILRTCKIDTVCELLTTFTFRVLLFLRECVCGSDGKKERRNADECY